MHNNNNLRHLHPYPLLPCAFPMLNPSGTGLFASASASDLPFIFFKKI
jgi:hypothetical protein